MNLTKILGILLVLSIIINIVVFLQLSKGHSIRELKQSKKYDSLHIEFNKLVLFHINESKIRQKADEIDQNLITQLRKQSHKDSILLKQQREINNKFKNFSSSVLIKKLDSAYAANH